MNNSCNKNTSGDFAVKIIDLIDDSLNYAADESNPLDLRLNRYFSVDTQFNELEGLPIKGFTLEGKVSLNIAKKLLHKYESKIYKSLKSEVLAIKNKTTEKPSMLKSIKQTNQSINQGMQR